MKIGTCFAGILSLVGVACSGTSGHSLGASIPGAALLSGKPEDIALPGVKLELSSSSLRLCDHPEGHMPTTISWDARATGVKKVTLWVSNNATSKGTRFFQGEAVGSIPTGDWVVNNTTFRLKETGKRGRLLAMAKVGAVDCLMHSPAISVDEPTPVPNQK